MRHESSIIRILVYISLFLSTYRIPAWPDEQNDFRFWTTNDGLVESYCSSVSTDPDGQIWINHGMSGTMSILDGYFIHNVPSPGSNLKITHSPSGEHWASDFTGIHKYENGKWHHYPIQAIVNHFLLSKQQTPYIIDLYSNGQNRVLFLLPHSLLEFDSQTSQVQIIKQVADTGLEQFLQMRPAQDGGIWITGEKRIAKIHRGGDRIQLDSRWEEIDFSQLGDFHAFTFPSEDDSNTLFLHALDPQNHDVFIIRKPEQNPIGLPVDNLVQGWKALDGCHWVTTHQSQQLHCLTKSHELLSPQIDAISGTIHDVEIEDQGVFWLATSQNLTRFTPPIWRTPAECPPIESIVHSIVQDDQDRIWFACLGDLLVFQNNQWKKFSLPFQRQTDFNDTQCLNLLADGRIVIQTRERKREILLFDPSTEQFITIDHPDNRKIRRSYSTPSGKVYFQIGDDLDFSIEEFSEGSFKPVLNLGTTWGFDHLRYFYKTQNYGLWLGGTGGLGIIQNGSFHSVNDLPNMKQNGAFCITEIQDGKVWIGGRNKILEYDGKKWIERWNGVDKARSMIRSRDGIVWIAAGNGIHRFTGGYWITNTKEDGLPSSIGYTVYEDRQGRIWAGTARGISLYHPDADQSPPDTFLTNQNLLKKGSPEGEIQVLFSGIDKWKHTIQERLYYSYRIDSEKWSPLSLSTIASIQNISPGFHTFEVRAVDRNGNMDPTPVSQKIRILLPWYREPVFLVITSLLTISILILLQITLKRGKQRKQAQTQLQKREELLRETQKLGKIGGWEYTLEDQSMYWTDEVYQIHEVSSDSQSDLIQVNLSCFSTEDRLLVENAFQRIVLEGEPYNLALPFTTCKGNSLWIRTMARAERREGRIVRIIGNIMDITQQKKMENQLLHFQKIESIGNLASGMAHNINNLLTGIIGNLNLARFQAPPTIENRLSSAQTAANRAAELIKNLLNFSKKNVITPKPVSVDQILDDVFSLIQGTFDRRIDIRENRSEKSLTIHADAAQIQSVLVNLCMNSQYAIKEILLNSPTRQNDEFYITIQAESKILQKNELGGSFPDKSGLFVLFSVIDNGIGMVSEIQKHLFEPFFTTHHTVGTGLGLASSRGIIEQHHGWIDFTSVYNEGSTFRVYLPADSTPVEKDISPKIEEFIGGGNETILIVDDDEIINQLNQFILEQNGYSVLVANDGQEGLDTFHENENKIDLIVLDISMPKLSGWEVVKRIRSTNSKVSILISSGYVGEEQKQIGSENMIIDGILNKPFQSQDLLKIVREILQAKSINRN